MAEVDARWVRLLALGQGPEDAALDDEAASLVQQLQVEAEVSVLELALSALSHDDPWHRRAAAWVLGQFGCPEGRPFGARVLPELLRAARAEGDDDVREDLVDALGKAEDVAWLDELLSFAGDPAPGVRRAVAMSVPGMPYAAPPTERALDALITLSSDPDPRVRDWATFGLGSQWSQDSPAIRAALRARLDDEDHDTAAEALLGLARRADPEALTRVRALIEEPDTLIGLVALEAAAELADPVLLPALEELARAWDGDEDEHTEALAFAIARCDPGSLEAARQIEQQIVTAVDERVAGTGWSLALTGAYPRTLAWPRRPDGAVDESVEPDLVWERRTPDGSQIDAVVIQCVTAIHEAAARRG
ncbi:HEAT repeat domain-containing protein [Cellulomonas sp. zg-ZUI222]|uniref:HEAT repeat domain-containing protein n=1 Tax=Cellulomonas wangleii TaxID=2816956 RepID=UPI001A94B4E5|nr:HEAT repeat domain-containing protein [Cellulomonas wangleii]MBO0922015.1 HEAT repeat domain-containing protein [Cellulomonas wangleii]